MEPQLVVDELLNKRKSEVEAMHSLSSLVGTNLDRRSVAILLQLLEYGVHPESLAHVIEELKAAPLQDTR